MPDRTSSARADETIVEIDSLIRQTHDEHARSRTIAVLHNHAIPIFRLRSFPEIKAMALTREG